LSALDFGVVSSYISIMAIMVSDKAAGQLSNILSEQGKPGASLRVWVAGLGCSGYRYGMGIDEKEPEEGDQIFESNGIRILVDPQSLTYMDGALVNWVEEPENSGFAIDNPNAAPQKECNCAGGCATGVHEHEHEHSETV
jgi:iron-sulfur cluster assembly protein